MKRKALLLISAVLIMSLGMVLGASAQETNDNIVDIVAASNQFDTLHTAIVEAGLADTLASADNTFTVFAPRDGAFNALEEAYPGLLNTLLADPTGDLTSILTYHVVPGKYMSGDVLEAGTLTTVQGEELTITTRGDRVFVNDARVITVDVPAKNGVIHIIDSVLVPSTVTLPEPAAEMPETTETVTTTPAATEPAAVIEAEIAAEEANPADLKSIAEVATEAGSFTRLLDALTATGLAETFAKPGNYTVFAPTDAAFEALGDVNLTESELRSILLFHVVGDALNRDQLATDDIIPTLDGRPLFVNRDGANIVDINGAKVLVYNIPASNGIIHVIDRVMIP
jgi:uncharacterized surface protein with fasciclin (FAS1) repeats